MRLLLDTHLLIWIAEDSDRLPESALRPIEDEANGSPAYEVSMKFTIARASFEIEPRAFRRGLLEIGFDELAISSEMSWRQTCSLSFTATRSTGFSPPRLLWKA